MSNLSIGLVSEICNVYSKISVAIVLLQNVLLRQHIEFCSEDLVVAQDRW